MAEAAFAGAAAASSVSPGSAVTYYGNFGMSSGAQAPALTTEAHAELVHRGPDATLKDLRVRVVANARAATSAVTTRKNNADTSQVASITASTTGTYTDLTNEVSVTAGDTVAYKLDIGSTSGAFSASSITVNYESNSGQAAVFWSGLGSFTYTNSSTSRWASIPGALALQSIESAAQGHCAVASVISNLRAYATAARTTDTTLTSRKNGAAGAMTVTLPASTTGAFEDTTNSDTLAAGDLFGAQTTTGTGSGSVTLSNVSVLVTPTTANVVELTSASSSAVQPASADRYYSPLGNLVALSLANENVAQQAAPIAGTASRLHGVVRSNASTTTLTMTLRDNAADTAVTYTIAGGATGVFEDTTNSVTVAAGDLLSIKGSGADGNVTFQAMGLLYTADSLGPTTKQIAGSGSGSAPDGTATITGGTGGPSTKQIAGTGGGSAPDGTADITGGTVVAANGGFFVIDRRRRRA